MAREAGISAMDGTYFVFHKDQLERFAAVAYAAGAAAEREACAKVCDHAEKNWRKSWHSGAEKIAADAVAHCATAIRARGNT